jgi:hypothetical protein
VETHVTKENTLKLLEIKRIGAFEASAIDARELRFLNWIIVNRALHDCVEDTKEI